MNQPRAASRSVRESATQPFVSILVPCRNEERFIGRCLDSILANDYPGTRWEVLVIDGGSEDGTRAIVAQHAERYPFVKLLDNPKRSFTAGVNIGVRASHGEIVMIMGAHASYESDYVSKCVKFSCVHNVDNLGGVLVATPLEKTDMARAIALVLSHPFGAGNALFRIGSQEPKEVDTVFGGCYRRDVFQRIGLFDEVLPRSADLDFNMRLKRAGGKILLVPEIVAYYYPKSNLPDFVRHAYDDGFWAVYPLRFGKRTFSWRHVIPLAFVSSVIVCGVASVFSPAFFWVCGGILGVYGILTIGYSAQLAVGAHHLRDLLVLPLAFVARHVPYGLGSLSALLLVLTSKEAWQSQFSTLRKMGRGKGVSSGD